MLIKAFISMMRPPVGVRTLAYFMTVLQQG